MGPWGTSADRLERRHALKRRPQSAMGGFRPGTLTQSPAETDRATIPLDDTDHVIASTKIST